MRFTQVFVFVIALIFTQAPLNANQIYLEYNSNCMDVYEYHYKGKASSLGHMVYHIALNTMEKIVLEVGVETQLNRPRKPSKTKTCKEFSLNERTVRQINNGEMELFIVRKDGRGYNVSPVGIATYVQINGTSVGFSTLDTRFSYNFSQPANGINIATNGSDSKVHYKGLVSNKCPKKYLFSKTRQKGGRSYAEWVVIPEIGIIEEKNGFNPADAQNNILYLAKINGERIDSYLEDYCNHDQAGENEGFYFDGDFGNYNQYSGRKPSLNDLESGKTTNKPRNRTNRYDRNNRTEVTTETGPDEHIFADLTCPIYKDLDKGVYMDWTTGTVANGECGGNKYVNGRMVGETIPSAVVTTPAVTTTTLPPAPQPTNTAAPVTNNLSNCPEVSSAAAGFHIVQRNETLYGIARLYGMSVDQLRRHNGGLRGDRIYPCMKLYTRTAGNTSPAREAAPTAIATDYNSETHTVQRGETLYQLAKRHGFTVDKFRKMNGLGPNERIYVGQILKTKDCNCPAPKNADYAEAFVPSEYNVTGARIDTEKAVRVNAKRRFHVVKEDDTVYSISRQHNVSVSRLRQINDLEENEIIIPYQRIYLEY